MTSRLSPGDMISHLELLAYKGGGAQAEVWSVRDTTYTHHTNLALKLYCVPWDRRDQFDLQEKVDRLEQESRLLGNCKTSHIVAPHSRIGGPEEINGQRYQTIGVLMDLASEGSLTDFRKTPAFQSFNESDKVTLMLQLAHGLHDIQHHDLVHCDIKPSNILINNEAGHFVPRYADFGHAFRRGEIPSGGGTPGYQAPEIQPPTTRTPDFDSDVFSLGITFYEFLVGRHPADDIDSVGEQAQALQGHHATRDYINSAPMREVVNKDICELVQEMCAREASKRPEVDEIIQRLEAHSIQLKSRETFSSDQAYPTLANRFRWASIAHEAFQEREQIVYLRGTRPHSDPEALAELLTRERLSGFTVVRLFGNTDYMLRLWRRESDLPAVEEALARYRSERGEHISFTPSLRFPSPTRKLRERYRTPAAVLQTLQQLADGKDSSVLAAARISGFVLGECKRRREATRKRHAIRLVCRVKAKKSLTQGLAEVICEKTYACACRLRGLKEVEVLGDAGFGSVPAEFLLIGEVSHFHEYGDALREISKIMSGLLGSESVEAYRSYFEMDRLPAFESYDGRLLYELHRSRPRRAKLTN